MEALSKIVNIMTFGAGVPVLGHDQFANTVKMHF